MQLTADDAALSKASSANLGYYEDDFILALLGRDEVSGKKAPRRSPLINRGYYSRVAAMDTVIDRFEKFFGEDRQIVSLGSGSDTTYFRLLKRQRAPKLYVELDLPDVATRKAAAIKSCHATRDLAPFADATPSADTHMLLTAPGYALGAVDLRDVPAVARTLVAAGVDFSKPTLLIAECVFVYVKPEKSRAILTWLATNFTTAVYAAYEQIRPEDAFGRTMVLNMRSRGCTLLSIHEYPTIASQEERLTSLCGWRWARALDMNDVYYKFLDKGDLARVEKLEIFDEFEEWHIMQAHYCLLVGATAVDEEATAAIAEALELKSK